MSISTHSTTLTDRPTVEVTTDELRAILARVKGATPIYIVSLTDPKPRKKALIATALDEKRSPIYAPLPWCEIRKMSRTSAMTATDYEEAVRRQQIREGSAPVFAAKERAWGSRCAPSLVVHAETGAFYLVAQINTKIKGPKPVYLARRTEADFLTAIEKDHLSLYLPTSNDDAVKAAQGVDTPVVHRTYALSSLVSLSMGGVRYKVLRSPRAGYVASVKRVVAKRPSLSAERWHELMSDQAFMMPSEESTPTPAAIREADATALARAVQSHLQRQNQGEGQ